MLTEFYHPPDPSPPAPVAEVPCHNPAFLSPPASVAPPTSDETTPKPDLWVMELAPPPSTSPAPKGWRLALRCTREYLAWTKGLADHLGGLTVTQLVDQGLRRLAEVSGYHQPPTRYHRLRDRNPSKPEPARWVPASADAGR